jgi:hypothetical protein
MIVTFGLLTNKYLNTSGGKKLFCFVFRMDFMVVGSDKRRSRGRLTEVSQLLARDGREMQLL